MGYCINGEVKALVVKDESGKIIARSILRSGLNENDQPILLLERYYGKDEPFLNEAIKNMAIDKAKKMGVFLVEAEGGGYLYKGKIHFLEGRAPYVYSDVGGGLIEGAFEVKKSRILYEP